MKKYSVGIDLGGTKILAGVVDKAEGKVLFEVKNKTKIYIKILSEFS